MRKIITIFGIVLLGVIAWGMYYNNTSAPDKNMLIEINDADLKDMLIKEESEFFIYIGRPTCPFCVKFLPTLEVAIQNMEFEFYSFNTDDNRENDFFIEVIDMLEIEFVPILMFIQNGEVIDTFEYNDGNAVNKIQDWIKNIS